MSASAAVVLCSLQACAGTTRTHEDVNCFLQHIAAIADCLDTYSVNEPNNNFTWDNATAYQACLDASDADKDLCEAGIDEDTREELWDEFNDNVRICLNTFPDDEPEAQQACIESAVDTYLDEVRDLLGPPGAGACVGIPVGGVRSIESLAAAPENVNGKHPISMMTTLSVTAGVSTQGDGYNIAQAACVHHAALAAICRTKDGIQTVILAADMHTSDGATFRFPLLPAAFVGADDVTLVTLFLSSDGDPIFAETAACTILPSPIQGDWNRDGVKNQQDVADYTEFYNLRKTRADFNDDANVDQDDLAAFLQSYSD